jgi:sec-independent protein translocase protein TatC
LVIASPFIFYYLAAFIFPALRLKERHYVYRGLGFGVGLFLTGVTFCYFLLMPLALAASQRYSEWLGFSAMQWKADEYISFVCKFMLGMGLGFEMPVIILTLVKIGVLNYTILAKGRRYMIVVNLFLGAVLTTPEVITQLIMFLPLQGLYEISIWIAWYWERQDRKKAAQQAENNSME